MLTFLTCKFSAAVAGMHLGRSFILRRLMRNSYPKYVAKIKAILSLPSTKLAGVMLSAEIGKSSIYFVEKITAGCYIVMD